MKILICGLPGSGKTTLAEPLAEQLGAHWLNADAVRTEYNDWDFSKEGRMRQADRMKSIANTLVKEGQVVVADFICPTKETRDYFGADFTIWMDTISKGRYEDTNAMYERLTDDEWDYHIEAWFDDTHKQIVPIIKRWIKTNEK